MQKFSESKKSDALWQRLSDKTTPELASAMRDYYSIYDLEMVEWYAKLYDPRIGGFYYSPSARDFEKTVFKGKEYLLLPDAESTCQALGFINSSGIAASVGGHYKYFLPEWMKEQIADYVYSLQDPDGYFYHPQWGKDIGLSRRGRDFNWCRGMLSELGREMKYPTVLDKKEEKTEATLLPDHLSSRAKFVDYLDSLDVNNKSYPAGNTLASQWAQIKSLGLDGVAIQYLNERQDPKTGLWHKDQNYYGVNGLMKISGLYNGSGLVIPHSSEAAMSAIAAIESDEQVNATVDLWNNWVAISNICASLVKFGGESGEAEAKAIRERLWRVAIGAVNKTKEKILPFKRSDHSYSYGRSCPSVVSQGMPVCVPNLDEGDINGCVIATVYMIGMVHSALGIGDLRVPLYGEDEARIFLDTVTASNAKK